MNQRFVNVNLRSEAGKQFTLRYAVRSHETGELWQNCLQESVAGGLQDTDRFLGFSSDNQQSRETLLARLQSTLSTLRKFHPELNLPDLDLDRLADSINSLHQNFAHSHLVDFLITKKNEKHWSEFNVLLHALESPRNNHSTGGPAAQHPRIVFTWKNKAQSPIPAHLYREFDIGLDFGHAYFNYAQVGRQIHEIFYVNDVTLPPSHIQPARFFSADTLLWFGQSFTAQARENTMQKMKKWFVENENLFNRSLLKWEDPRLAIGQVAVGRLADMPGSDREKLALVKKISEFSHVSSVVLES